MMKQSLVIPVVFCAWSIPIGLFGIVMGIIGLMSKWEWPFNVMHVSLFAMWGVYLVGVIWFCVAVIREAFNND